MVVIDAKNLVKRFDGSVAVDNINFKVDKGEIFAFLGPNGAGKSTTIKMLTTVLFPTKGDMKIAGSNVLTEKDKVRESIGVIFEDHTLDDELTVYENLYYHAVLYKVPKDKRREKIEKLLDYVGLLSKKNDIVKTFSSGMKRRVEIARSLLHSPKILFLDEPTLGLDVQTRSFLWNYIKKINKEQGITIFFTTHNMEEAEKVATRISIIDKGKIITSGTMNEIKKKTKTKSLEESFLALTGRNIREQSADQLDIMRRRFSK